MTRWMAILCITATVSRLRSATHSTADSTRYCPKTGRIGVRMTSNQQRIAGFRSATTGP